MLSDSTRIITIPAVQVLTAMASYRPNKRVDEEKSRTIGFFGCGL